MSNSSYVRKAHRAANALNNPRFSEAVKIANLAFKGTQFVEDADGQRVRVWGDDGYKDYVTDMDVRDWLSGNRVVELREGLEYLRQSYIDTMVSKDWLRKDSVGGFYWITAAAAERFKLPKVLGRAFPK